MGFAPVISPIVGNFIICHFGWQYTFLAMALYSVTILILIFFVLENKLPESDISESWLKILIKNYKVFLKDSRFMLNGIIMMLFYAGLFAFITQTPILFVQMLHISAQDFGIYFAFIILLYCFGNITSSRLTKKVPLNTIKFIAIMLGNISGVFLTIFNLTSTLSIVNVFLPTILYAFATGMILPISMASSLSSSKQKAGTGSGILGFMQMMVSALVGSIVSYAFLRHTVSLGLCFFVVSSISSVCLFLLYKREKQVISLKSRD